MRRTLAVLVVLAVLAVLAGAATLACSRPQPEKAPMIEGSAAPAEPAPSASGKPGKQGKSGEPCESLFDAPAGATKLCSESVLGQDAEIVWSSYAVTTDRYAVFDAYRAKAHACEAGFTNKPPILSVSKNDKRLSIHEASETGYPSCEKKPSSEHKSVIVISDKFDRKAK